MRQLYLLVFIIIIYSCGTPNNLIPSISSNEEDYIELKNNITSTPRYLSGNTLNIIYRENYNDQDDQLEYVIRDQKQVVVQSNASHPIGVMYGINKISIPLNSISSGIYVLEVINEKGVKQYLTFLKSV